jgi:hypothetical protein
MYAAPMTMKNENEFNRFGRFAAVKSPPLLRCPANSRMSGKRTEMRTGKMMIEYQMFFWCLNNLKSLAAISHALDNLMQTPS